MSTARFVKVNGLDLRYLAYGNDAKPTIVFYHATGFVSELWQPIIRELADDYHCIALDQRGHGGSDKRAAEHTWSWTADDFLKFLEAMQLKRVIGIGHSSGATSIAVTAGRKPELIERMVLIEPTVRARVVPPNMMDGNSPLIERTRNRRASWPNRQTLDATLFQRPPYNSWTPEMQELFTNHAMATNGNGELTLLCAPAVEAEIYTSFPKFDPWPYLPVAPQPTLVIHGSGPSVMPTTRVAEVMPSLQHARLVELPEGGHLILMEAPQPVTAAIRTFLRETKLN